MTIFTGNDPTLVSRLTWPENVIVQSESPGVVINPHNTRPKRHLHYGLCRDKTKAGIVKIPRPKLPKKELTAADSKLGHSMPNLSSIRFGGFDAQEAKGKRLLICFWDMDQRPSRQCLQALARAKSQRQDTGRVVLAVHAGEKQEEQVRQWLATSGISLPVGTVQGDPYDTLFAWGGKKHAMARTGQRSACHHAGRIQPQ